MKKLVTYLSIVLVAIILQACKGGTIRDVTFQTGGLGTVSHFELAGDGVCGKVSIDFGDGTPPAEIANYDFSNAPPVNHVYAGWPGKKTVKTGSLENCVGNPQKVVSVGPPLTVVAYRLPRPSACDAIPNKPPLRVGTIVHMTTNPDPNIRIKFGCSFNGCIYDADGKNPSSAVTFSIRDYVIIPW